MRFFDLHCDTLYESLKKGENLYDNSLHISLKKSQKYRPYIGCFAVWIPDEKRGKDALELFDSCVSKLFGEQVQHEDIFKICSSALDIESLVKSDSKNGIILTVEGGAILGGKLENIDYIRKKGVRIMTLTWNGSCEIGDGVGASEGKGLTEFGKKAIEKMEQSGIIVDISHASERLFYDVCDASTKPFIATHSNSKRICNHRRNLTDEQFRIIVNRGGIVGINFCNDFLSDRGSAKLEDIIRHAEHFLELGGSKAIAIGSDFDGCDMPAEISGIERIENLYEYFLKRNYPQSLVDDIFFNNAYNFMLNNL